MHYETLWQNSIENATAFWAEKAQMVDWFEFPSSILSTDEHGLYRWYKGGKLNVCHLALDHHVAHGRGEQTAIIYDSPVTNTTKRYTYRELLDDTARFAGALQTLGVTKGDRVIIYMPMVPEVVCAMLACARLGAIHSVVFGGFAPHELALRIDDAKPKVLLTATAGIEVDKIIPYMPLVEAAMAEATHKPDHVVLLQRECLPVQAPNCLDWVTIQAAAAPVPCVVMDATDPLYILYTSGTTGKPKGIVRDSGGYAVALRYSMEQVYGAAPGDVYWAASDVGWVVGHSYIVYAPLITGCTSVFYEGKPVRTPDAGAFWRVIEQYGVQVFFTAPTGFRAVKKEDPEGLLKQKYDISTLRRLFLAGERCDVATLEWAQQLLGIPVIDHWWQTESGWPMLSTPLDGPGGVRTVKPGSAGLPVPGFQIEILDAHAQPVAAGDEGAVGIRLPLPPGCLPTLWQNPDQFKESYLQAYPGYYFTGDGGYCDQEGYFFITGRIDDVINVAGHRLSTADMEEIVAAHPMVAECAVIGVADELKGQVPVGFVVLKAGVDVTEQQLESELVKMVRERLGAVAFFKKALIVKRLPKTRSGKILRRIMRHIADDKPYQAPSTIEDLTVLDEIKASINQ